MKYDFKQILIIAAIFSLLFFVTRCEEDDSKKSWGISLIYMPQASFLDGGTTNNYPVPLPGNVSSQNYIIDSVSNTINIVMGVCRSGMQSSIPYTVDVITKSDTVNQLIEEGRITNAVLLPSDLYTIPEKVSVSDGKREGTFLLTIDRQKLIDKYSNLSGKKLVLAIGIANPSNYEINPALSTTIIIIDSKSFLPPPPIVNLLQGGDMEADSKQYWMWTNSQQEWGYTQDRPVGGQGGCLKWYEAGISNVNGMIYHQVQLEQGKQYQLSAKVKIPAGCSNFWIDFDLTDITPGQSGWDATGDFMGIWTEKSIDLLDGDIRTVGNIGWGKYGNGLASGSNGMFTASASTMYVFIKLGICCGSSFTGPVLIDDVQLIKVE